MNNSDQFLSIYNKLDNELRSMDHAENYVGFTSIVNRLSKSRKLIKHFRNQLLEYNDLRNAIVHERIDGRVIAEPNDYALKDFQRIYDRIVSPKLALDVCKGSVKSLKSESKLSAALNLMQKDNLSVIPIYDHGAFVEMLNAETITAWLKNNIRTDAVNLSDTLIKDVLSYRSDQKKTVLVSRNTSVFEIIDIYKKNVYEANQIDAILVTHNGKASEKPLGLIDDSDIPMILDGF